MLLLLILVYQLQPNGVKNHIGSNITPLLSTILFADLFLFHSENCYLIMPCFKFNYSEAELFHKTTWCGLLLEIWDECFIHSWFDFHKHSRPAPSKTHNFWLQAASCVTAVMSSPFSTMIDMCIFVIVQYLSSDKQTFSINQYLFGKYRTLCHARSIHKFKPRSDEEVIPGKKV